MIRPRPLPHRMSVGMVRFRGIRRWWCDHRMVLLRIAVVILALCAIEKLCRQFPLLLWEPGWRGAGDLQLRHRDVHAWFAGRPVYGALRGASYPPASYAILWPLLGWLAVTPSRWLWGATTVLALIWLTRILVRESGAETPPERAFVALLALAMEATAVAIGKGQLILHLLAPLLTGLLLLPRRNSWRADLPAAALIAVALAKPTIALPFLWLALFLPGRVRPAILIALGYAALTAAAVSFQRVGLAALLRDWRTRASMVELQEGSVNLSAWLCALGLREWALPAALLVLLALGVWTYRLRRVDPWLLIGVTAVVARLCIYHRMYDDVLILLPMVALFRIARQDAVAGRVNVPAELLLAVAVLASLVPWWIVASATLWSSLVRGGLATVWIAVLLFLDNRARRESRVDAGIGSPHHGSSSCPLSSRAPSSRTRSRSRSRSMSCKTSSLMTPSSRSRTIVWCSASSSSCCSR